MEVFRMTMNYAAHDFYLKEDADAEINNWERICNQHLNHIKKLKKRHKAEIAELKSELNLRSN